MIHEDQQNLQKNFSHLPRGVYHLHLKSGVIRQTKKMVLLPMH